MTTFSCVSSSFIILCAVGCHASDEGSQRSKTAYKLQCLAKIASRLEGTGIRWEKVGSIDELLSAAARRQLITKDDFDERYFAIDGWRREFRYKKTNQSGGLTIQIISDGENGAREREKTSDLLLEIHVDAQGHCQIIREPGRN